MRFKISWAVALCAAISILLPVRVTAAGNQPPITGIVRDTAGAPLPNARVAIIGLDRFTTTDATGAFTFEFVPAGRYELYTTLIGYAPARTPVTVPPTGEPVAVAITMTPSLVRLAAVQVTATRFAADPLDVTQSTVELSGQALNRNLGASVAQTLADEPGLAMRYNGPAANMPVVRGLTGDRVLVLQNGERVGDLAAPTADHALTVDPLAATSIEVIRGPAALLYGSNALGGVVNVISRDIPTTIPNHVEGNVSVQGESVNPGGAASVGLTVPLSDRLAGIIGVHHRSVDDVRMGGGGHLENSFARQTGGQLGLGYVGSRFSAGAAYQGMRFRYGLPMEEHEDGEEEPGHAHEDVTIEGFRHQVTGRGTLRFDGRAVPVVRLEATGQWYEHDEIEEGEVETHFQLRTQTVSATGRTNFGNRAGAIGASGLFRQYEAEGEEALTPPADSRSFGFFAFQDFPLMMGPDTARVPHLHVGARYDHTTVESREGEPRFGGPVRRRFGTFSGSAGLVLPLSRTVSLNANVARAFRAPTVEELFSRGFHAAAGTFDVGNPELREETSNGGEIVLRGRGPRLNAQFSAYYNRLDNYIAVDIVGDTTINGAVVPLNRYAQVDATLRGLEGQIEREVTRGFVIGGMGDLVRGALKDGTPLPFIPAARLGGLLRWQQGQFDIETSYRHGFAQRRVPPPATDEDPSAVATEAYDLVNVSVGYTLIRGGLVHTVTMRVDNLFDERYRDATSRIKHFAFNPGRNFALVYRVLF